MGNQPQGGDPPSGDAIFEPRAPAGPMLLCGAVDQHCRSFDHPCRPDVFVVPCNDRPCCNAESGCDAPQNLGFEDIRKLIRGGDVADLTHREFTTPDGGSFDADDYSVPPDDPVIAPQLKTPRGAGRSEDASLFDPDRLSLALAMRVDHHQPERQLIFSDMDPPGEPLEGTEGRELVLEGFWPPAQKATL